MSVFETTSPLFEAFLARAKDDLALAPGSGGAFSNTRFIPRNFLNEERLDPSRLTSYATGFPTTGITDFAEWVWVHNLYLKRHVFVVPPATHDYRTVAPDNPNVCPETFRAPLALSTFQGTDFDTVLIRLVPVSDLAWLARALEDDENKIFSLGEQVMADPSDTNPAWQELSRILEEAYTGEDCQHRPVFASFYEDFLDELNDPANMSWPNQLRDRLGLYHINQWQKGGLPRRVFLFHYKVREIPRHPGKADSRPLAVPVVIDHRLFEAFCPAPHELDRGRLLNLDTSETKEPAREVLHLFMPLQVEHLFRVGQVTTPAPEDLASARCDHLTLLRVLSGRDDYGSATDADLF